MRTGSASFRSVALWVGLFAALLLPVATVGVPPLQDYPSQLARDFVLTHWADMPALRANYVPDWRVKPDMGGDLFVAALSSVLPYQTAAKLFLVLSMALPVAGCAALSRALHARVGVLPMAAALFVYNLCLVKGLDNYLFGMGVMLMAFAGWIRSDGSPVWVRTAAFSAAMALLFFIHLLPVAEFYLLVGAYELARWPGTAWNRRLERAAPAALSLLPVLLLWTMKPAGAPSATLVYGTPQDHVGSLLGFMFFYWDLGDRLFMAPVAWAAVMLALSRRGPVRPMWWPLTAMAAAALLLPEKMIGGTDVNVRLAAALAPLLVAALPPQTLPSRHRSAFVATVFVLVAARSAEMVVRWRPVDALFAEFRAAARVIPPGARVLPVTTPTRRSVQKEQLHPLDRSCGDRPVYLSPVMVKVRISSPSPPRPPTAPSTASPQSPSRRKFWREAPTRRPRRWARWRSSTGDGRVPTGWTGRIRFDYVVHVHWGHPGDLLPGRWTAWPAAPTSTSTGSRDGRGGGGSPLLMPYSAASSLTRS